MGILLGTSGWEYSEWVGPVYPRVGGRDRLRYYAGIFPIVEVNSTFYRLPAPSVARRWVGTTAGGRGITQWTRSRPRGKPMRRTTWSPVRRIDAELRGTGTRSAASSEWSKAAASEYDHTSQGTREGGNRLAHIRAIKPVRTWYD